LLDLLTLRWQLPLVYGVPPPPRGGHTATLVGNCLVIFGGCDGGPEPEQDDGQSGLVERDRSDLVILDLDSMHYLQSSEPCDEPLSPRSGHTAHLIPAEGGVALLILGGREYHPPLRPWEDGQHLGRDEVCLLTTQPTRTTQPMCTPIPPLTLS